MKKKILFIISIVLTVLVMVGCGKKATCFYCGEEKKCEQVELLIGETVDVCEDCLEELQSF